MALYIVIKQKNVIANNKDIVISRYVYALHFYTLSNTMANIVSQSPPLLLVYTELSMDCI